MLATKCGNTQAHTLQITVNDVLFVKVVHPQRDLEDLCIRISDLQHPQKPS